MTDKIINTASEILDAAKQLANRHAVDVSAALTAIHLATPAPAAAAKPAAEKKPDAAAAKA